MTKRMLIDSTHAEETRVVVLDGTRLEDFDVETSAKRHLKGNIYLAKVVRVEPSLQAAFVEYGGNRHGFLAFSEIHPDYYQIPVADRQRLLEMEAEEARREEEEDELELALNEAPPPPPRVAEPARQGRGRRDRRPGRNRFAATETAIEQAVAAETWARADTPPLIVVSQPAMDRAAEPEPWALSATPVLVVPTAPAPIGEPDWALPATPALVTADMSALEAETAVAPEPTHDGESVVEAWARANSPALVTDAPAWPDEFAALEPSHTHDDHGYDERSDDDRRYDGRGEVDRGDEDRSDEDRGGNDTDEDDGPPPETLGGDPDSVDDREERRLPPRFLRNYKIQEVIRRRQIMLVQVVKEERGTKGAALTTYLSLAGRFSVLMPNSPRGGGISRKITSAADRRRLKEVMVELDIPRGMGLIIRTAGAARPKPEIKRDCEYLLRLWDDIREHTMKSIAPALIYEEASLIKRAIRDVYSRDIDEIQVDGTEGWRAAHEFMRMLMPSHARKVQLWNERDQPLFARYQVESQLDAMLNPIVQLRSGGYLVINQTEALVAIDVNSGRATRERNVEETALRTNLEAADEVARQLRLRDLAGLIVIDFIDMESRRHNAMVERRLKDALRNDRARIQVGHISHFGLLEMSRQRLRPSLTETSFITCPHCGGMGHVRSTESAAIHVLRGIEDEGSKRRAAEAIVHVSTPIALYLLNHKRDRLGEIERRYGMRVIIAADDTQVSPRYRIERLRAQIPGEVPQFITPDAPQPALVAPYDPEEDEEPVEAPVAAVADDSAAEQDEQEPRAGGEETAEEQERRRRRRRRRGRRDERGDAGGPPREDAAEDAVPAAVAVVAEAPAEDAAIAEPAVAEGADGDGGDDGRGRRRGRRGGRRRRRDGTDGPPEFDEPGAERPEMPPVYAGPTPADPFGGQAFDIFDVMEQVEAAEAARAAAPPPAVVPPAPETWASAAIPPIVSSVRPAAVAAPVEPAEPVPPPVVPASTEPEAWAATAVPSLLRQDAAVLVEPESAPKPAPATVVVAKVVAEPAPAPEPEPVPAPVANDTEPVVGPAIKPVVIGQDTAPQTERRRGWWRRG